MKRGIKGLLVLVVFGLFGIFLMGVVSADTNFAASSNGGVASVTIQSGWSEGQSITNINDENDATYYGVGITDNLCWSMFTSTIMFSETAPEITQIDYIEVLNSGGADEEYAFCYTYVRQGGVWSGNLGGCGPVAGSWLNVEGVRVYLEARSQSNFGCTSYARLFEVEALGPDPCTPTLTCSDYPGQCGSGLSDGCEDILDCSSNCGVGEVCQGGVCVITEDDIIMKLYSSTNSHGALWNDADYNYDICYSNVFGSTYTGASPHTCTENNKVLGLYASSNSHAEIPSLDNYNVDVCYGDLVCEADESVGDSCVNGGEIVVRLYQDTNSHISNASDSNYPIKICCNTGVVPSVLEWRDMSGNVITNAQVGDSVQMVMTNSLNGTFEIWEEDDGFWGYIFGGDDDIKSVEGVAVGSDLVGVWTITDEDLEKTSDYGEFQFGVNGEVSGDLAIDLNENDDLMVVSIVAPNCGDDFDEGESIAINVIAVDGDDLIDGNVTINGLVVPFSNGGVIFDYTFNIPGNHQGVVEAINSRGKRSRSIVSVMVLDMEGGNYVDGSYVAACIDKPEDFSNIPGSVVVFDASNTRGIKVVGGDVNYILPGSGDLDFYWSFFPDGRTYGEQYAEEGDSLAYDFITEFAVAGDNSAVLRVEVD